MKRFWIRHSVLSRFRDTNKKREVGDLKQKYVLYMPLACNFFLFYPGGNKEMSSILADQ
jgi:hypothetical protein